MGNWILGIITFCAIDLFIYYIYRAIKKSESLSEKLCDIVIAMVSVTILIIYFVDRFDIPTLLEWNTNVNSQNWLSFIGNYVTGIISASIGAIVSVYITIYQIKKNNEENGKRDKENFRIQNMPLLKYDCVQGKNTSIKLTQLDTNIDNSKGVIQEIKLSLKNIGLNTIRKYYIRIKSDILKREYIFKINNEQIIEK